MSANWEDNIRKELEKIARQIPTTTNNVCPSTDGRRPSTDGRRPSTDGRHIQGQPSTSNHAHNQTNTTASKAKLLSLPTWQAILAFAGTPEHGINMPIYCACKKLYDSLPPEQLPPDDKLIQTFYDLLWQNINQNTGPHRNPDLDAQKYTLDRIKRDYFDWRHRHQQQTQDNFKRWQELIHNGQYEESFPYYPKDAIAQLPYNIILRKLKIKGNYLDAVKKYWAINKYETINDTVGMHLSDIVFYRNLINQRLYYQANSKLELLLPNNNPMRCLRAKLNDLTNSEFSNTELTDAIITIATERAIPCLIDTRHIPTENGAIYILSPEHRYTLNISEAEQKKYLPPDTVIFDLAPLPIKPTDKPLDQLLQDLFYFQGPDDLYKLIAFMISAIYPHPIANHLQLNGESNTGKTTVAKTISRILTGKPPTSVDLARFDATKAYSLKSNMLILLDNKSTLPSHTSDLLCTLADGRTIEDRLPYDHSPIKLDVKTPVIITAINDVIRKPDLRSRTYTIDLARSPLTPHQFNAKLNERLPYIRHALLTLTQQVIDSPYKPTNERLQILTTVQAILTYSNPQQIQQQHMAQNAKDTIINNPTASLLAAYLAHYLPSYLGKTIAVRKLYKDYCLYLNQARPDNVQDITIEIAGQPLTVTIMPPDTDPDVRNFGRLLRQYMGSLEQITHKGRQIKIDRIIPQNIPHYYFAYDSNDIDVDDLL